MRQGPRNNPRDSRARPTPQAAEPVRGGIRALDCGEEAAPETTIIRRAASDDPAANPPADAGQEDEQRRSP
jgi:hypothetical protein